MRGPHIALAQRRQRSGDGAVVTRVILTAALLAAAAGAAAMPTSFRVVSARVARSGVYRAGPVSAQTPAECARFALSNRAALRYFARAREVDEHTWREALDWTPCSAAGTLRTGDGKTYRWAIDQSGRTTITVTGRVAVYLDGPEFAGAR